LAQILNTVPSSAHGAHYAGIVREKSLLRQLIAASNNILRECYAPHEQADLVVDKAEKQIFEIAQKKVGGAMVPLESVLHEVFEMIENRGQRGLETGFFDLDDMLNGLQNGEMVIVAARPSMGKTALSMNFVEGLAAERGIPCAIFSLEMSKQQLAQRMLCSRGKIDSHKLRRGMLQSHEYAHLANVVGQLAKAPVWVDDSPGLTILDLRAKARRLKLQHDIKCIMIDYMQLMDNPGPDSRQQQISEISRGIKAVARELNVPVIALSQLNRQSEGRDGHRPRMSDLRESGSIEQDADVIMLLHREDYYKMAEPDFQPDNIAELIIAKQRNGPTGTIKLYFDSKSTRFENLAAQAEPF
jgi:replicative DNA helicase